MHPLILPLTYAHNHEITNTIKRSNEQKEA